MGPLLIWFFYRRDSSAVAIDQPRIVTSWRADTAVQCNGCLFMQSASTCRCMICLSCRQGVNITIVNSTGALEKTIRTMIYP